MASNLRGRINSINDADEAYLRFLFVKFRNHVCFHRKCLKLHLKPKFIKFRLFSDCNQTTKKLDKFLTEKWIRTELREAECDYKVELVGPF